ncbi:MAG: PIN domain nuclease [Spirochaetae bacterium HGW-Spirochaetae-1]|jgi:PIN domain nuclease of toxin-antitoxin system|nr:MAG: PIN domain nuclease [Spirochaetae bacterium HGW-Spirochaetae-1]
MIVLDTHVLIWLVNGDERIRKSGFLSYINKALKDHSIIIPAICMWEIAMLVSKERISLSENTLDWIRNVTAAPGISIHPLSPEVAYESTVLPGDFHGDPADRMIVATARVLDATLLTFDEQKIKYGENGFVKVKKPSRS